MTLNGSNAPEFDPLNCTEAESDQMVHGYSDGFYDLPPPRLTSAAYDHGRRNGVSDRTGHVEDDQRALARRRVDMQRSAAA
jgi:hypothetical protein